MLNFYKIIKDHLNTNKFVLNEIIGFEYSCPLEAENVALFSRYDYVIHVLSGKKTYKTIHEQWTLTPGQTLYLKKGAEIVHQYMDEQYCMLGFIITDDLIREVFNDIKGKLALNTIPVNPTFTGVEVQKTALLNSYFDSMLAYFRGYKRPPDPILLLKVKELLITLMDSDSELKHYFASVAGNNKPSLKEIMENNYCFNLKLDEYADLTNRSLSSFKRDFQKEFGEPPGKWLNKKRISRAANLILNTQMNITQVALESGFEDLSHFSRTFKKSTGSNPSAYKQKVS